MYLSCREHASLWTGGAGRWHLQASAEHVGRQGQPKATPQMLASIGFCWGPQTGGRGGTARGEGRRDGSGHGQALAVFAAVIRTHLPSLCLPQPAPSQPAHCLCHQWGQGEPGGEITNRPNFPKSTCHHKGENGAARPKLTFCLYFPWKRRNNYCCCKESYSSAARDDTGILNQTKWLLWCQAEIMNLQAAQHRGAEPGVHN